MPSKKRPKTSSTAGPVMIILEEIRSQNRATIETVEARHQENRRDLQDFRAEVRGDMQVVQEALHALGRARAARESRDLEILNAAADALNREMEDVLAYQIRPHPPVRSQARWRLRAPRKGT